MAGLEQKMNWKLLKLVILENRILYRDNFKHQIYPGTNNMVLPL